MTVIGSEFAVVNVEVDNEANGPRLKIKDLQSGRVAYFDALELETLAWLPDEELERFVNPSAHRWRDLEDDLEEITNGQK